ncbi:MAG: FAD-dependent oxidoreductase [Firmicutes bacterium]|nr:FAD-dependent oxidoreductase [Bacillota bacterium]
MSNKKATNTYQAKYAIIGNSAGAVGCVEGIRRVDKEGDIILLAAEPYHTYSRPLISYLLLGRTDEQRMKYRPDDFYSVNGVQTLLGAENEVLEIDAAKKRLRLADGSTVLYEKLLAATGSLPFVPPTKGLDMVANCFSFMSLDDAQALAAAISPESRVLVVGAGLIGLKCVEGIAERVKQVTVVDLADRILSSILNAEAAEVVQRYLESRDIQFILGDCVKEFKPNMAMAEVVLEGAKAAGAEAERGVLVDEYCRTSLPDVFAAGDCTQGYDVVSGERRILALLPNAYMQGDCAGANMAGQAEVYKNGLALNSIGFWGLHIMSAGVYQGEALVESDAQHYKCLFVQDGRLNGFIRVGDVARAGIYTNLVRTRQPLDEVDWPLLQVKPQLMAFSPRERAQKLAIRPVASSELEEQKGDKA